MRKRVSQVAAAVVATASILGFAHSNARAATLVWDSSNSGGSLPSSIASVPDVTLTYSSGMTLFSSGYDFNGVSSAILPSADGEVDLTADAGREVVLSGFDLAYPVFGSGFDPSIQIDPGVTIYSGAGTSNVLYSSGPVDIYGKDNSGSHYTAVRFSQPLKASEIRIFWSGANNSENGLASMQDLSYSSTSASAVPEPASAWLLLCGLAVVILLRRRGSQLA